MDEDIGCEAQVLAAIVRECGGFLTHHLKSGRFLRPPTSRIVKPGPPEALISDPPKSPKRQSRIAWEFRGFHNTR
eukprot:4762387-Amphidinium_carterae.1